MPSLDCSLGYGWRRRRNRFALNVAIDNAHDMHTLCTICNTCIPPRFPDLTWWKCSPCAPTLPRPELGQLPPESTGHIGASHEQPRSIICERSTSSGTTCQVQAMHSPGARAMQPDRDPHRSPWTVRAHNRPPSSAASRPGCWWSRARRGNGSDPGLRLSDRVRRSALPRRLILTHCSRPNRHGRSSWFSLNRLSRESVAQQWRIPHGFQHK